MLFGPEVDLNELGKEVADMYDLESGEHFDDMQQEFKQRIGELVSAK